ncbi:MAG TPA: glycoside hydrolase family 15 protein [Candidatus Binataceae bacterium]|nr:glycoside hydrolase family 15 protein [Candidatus Binataceae bacterium]
MALRIEDYALIGNTLSAALVGRDGSIDWLCMPRFDSGACFAALLGEPDNGRWLIAPDGEITSTRRSYRGDTLIVETEFHTASGVAAVIDFMPFVEHGDLVDVVRIVEGRRGTVPMKMELTLRFDYGHLIPWVVRRDYGLRAVAGPDAVALRTPARLHGQDFTTIAHFSVKEGQSIPFTITWYPSHRPEPPARQPHRMLDETERRWKAWSAQCTYDGPWREQVMRSLITLKGLTYAPTGGIVAAPTTSLPERVGGVRNWDYRFCWLRDATFTLYALLSSGYNEEARAWREWLLRSVAGHPQELQVLYGIAGERRLVELELKWFEGYAGSRPVRIGNAAHAQFQLDVWGEVMDMLHLDRKHSVEQDAEAWAMQRAMMKFLESAWQKPDNGIWEIRGPRRHFTHSKVMAWVAFDRAIKAVEVSGLDGPVERWRALREQIHADVMHSGFNRRRKAFVQFYGGETLDASLLMLPLVGFIPATDPRMVSTVAAIERELIHDGFVKRYASREDVEHLPPGEGAFLPCSFWLVDNLALVGQETKARALFERLLGLCNDVGLIAEEYDPDLKRQLGNFPQAFTHVSLVNSACNLSRAHGPAHRRSSG